MKYLYGKSWEKYPIKENEVWYDAQTKSSLMVCDIIKDFPDFMLKADMIYCDPPWNMGNANCFYTKAGKEKDYIRQFFDFFSFLFDRIQQISPACCYLEIGKQNKGIFFDGLKQLFPIVQIWKIKYYNKFPCYLLRGSISSINFDYTGIDDAKTPYLAIKNENPLCIADLCTGQGLTAIACYKLGQRFVGTELNKRRLAVAIDKVNKLGGKYEGPIS